MDELTNKDWRVISKAIEKTPKRKRILVVGTIRGRKIFAPDGMNWVSMRTGLKYKKDPPCIKCGKYPTKEGHDHCLGTLKGVKFACCGHGVPGQRYVMLDNGKCIYDDNLDFNQFR